MVNSCAVVLAGGKGTRMVSELPKVLMETVCTPMLWWVLDACYKSGIQKICTVTGYKHETVNEFLNANFPNVKTAYQNEQKGTAHALSFAREFIQNSNCENLLVLCGDAPLMDSETISNAYNHHVKNKNAVTIITAEIDEPTGYGRIVRKTSSTGNTTVEAIVEQKELSNEQFDIKEVNSGGYWFNTDALLNILDKISNNNSKGEFYLTDAVELLAKENYTIDAFVTKNNDVVLGANTCEQLYELSEIARKKILYKHLSNGVKFACMDGVIITPAVTIGKETVIYPNTQILQNSKIGENCAIGPNSMINSCTVGNGSIINASQLNQSEVGENVKIGPFSQVRPNCKIADNVKIGDFVEVKNSNIGEKTSISHLTYVGDSDVGGGVNFGCGVVTVNYDGKKKFRTVIKNKAFIGCNTNLVAPVEIGENAYTAAGSTITKNVPPHSLAIERGKQAIKEDWVIRKNNR